MIKTCIRLIALVIAILVQQGIQYFMQVRLGAIPILIIYFLAYVIADKICKRMD